VPARLGVQLYTVRDVFPSDFVGVLEMVKRIGYDEVEFAGYHEREPRVVRAVLDDIGLTAPATHVGLDALQQDLDAQIEAAQIVGHRYVVVPWLDEDARTSLDDYRRIADTFNTLGARMQAEGLQFAYHNHDFEFETFGGEEPGYDVLLAETDPALVQMEMDLFWTVHAGHDPLDYFARHPGRFPLFHVKDRTPDGTMVDVGAGAIDFGRIFAEAEQAGLRHAFVEHDEPGESLASIQASYAHLERLRGS
jgi:sugar phosphate isomerase/epimerase